MSGNAKEGLSTMLIGYFDMIKFTMDMYMNNTLKNGTMKDKNIGVTMLNSNNMFNLCKIYS